MSSWKGSRVLPSMLGMMPSSREWTGSASLRLSRTASRRRCSKWVDLDSDFSLSSTSPVGFWFVCVIVGGIGSIFHITGFYLIGMFSGMSIICTIFVQHIICPN